MYPVLEASLASSVARVPAFAEPSADRSECAVLALSSAIAPPSLADDEVLLTAKQVCTKLGGISLMTLWRWLKSDVVRFPQPTLILNSRRYWSTASIRRWLAERSEGPAA